MAEANNVALLAGPSGRSNSMLRHIIDELAQKEVLLGTHVKSIAPTKPVTVIEYESLIFEEPPESALMRSIRTGSKNAESTTIDGPNCNRIGYKNIGLWSPRSINLEQCMKPLLNISVALWPDYETFNDILSQADLTEGPLKIAMVDTLLVRMNEAHEVRYGFDRLYSHWSYASDLFEVRKEWVDKIELDILVLSLINDHTASLQLKKEQARLGGMQRQTQSHTSASASATLSAASKIHKIVSALGVNPNAGNMRRKVLSEGECRTHAVLKAVCRDGSVHIRPLCTSGDVLLALHELLDPVIFIHGCIQLPHVLSDIFARHTEGFYRYVYTMNQPGQWQYLRIALPSHLQSLNQFVQPGYVDNHVFHTEHIPNDHVPAELRDVSIHITKLVVRHYGKAQLLQRMMVDFEACMDISQGEPKPRKKQKRNNAMNSANNTHNTHATHGSTSGGTNTNTSNSISNNADLYGANIPAPHLQSESANKNYHFRLLHIAETQFLQCWAGQRRDAVCYMHPATKIQLRNFDSYFAEQWELRKREHNRLKAEQFMSQQSGSIKTIHHPTTPGMMVPGVLNLNTKSVMFGESMSPMHANSTSGGGGRGTLRVSSHTPFSPFSPIRSVRIDTIGSFSPMAGNNSSRGSMLRPGSTISTKGINNNRATFDSSSNKYSSNTPNTANNTNNASSKIDNAFIREMMSNPRSAKNLPRKPDAEADPAKLDAIHLVNLLFPRKYRPIVVKKHRARGGSGSSSDGSGDSGEDSEDTTSTTSGAFSGSGSDSDDVSDDASEVESEGSVGSVRGDVHTVPADTNTVQSVFQFVPHTSPTHTTTQVRSPRQQRFISSTQSEKVSFAIDTQDTSHKYSTHIPSVPLSRVAGSSNFNTSGLVRGTGTIIKQSLLLTGAAPKRHSITPAVTPTTNPDAAILAKYHVTEKTRLEREKRRAEERRIKQEVVDKLTEEKHAAEARRQAGNNSLYFVTRTNIKPGEGLVPGSPGVGVRIGSGVSTSGGTSGGTSSGAVGTPPKPSSRNGSPNTNTRKSTDFRALRLLSIADAQRERRRLRRGATQSLDIAGMDEDAAQKIFSEEERRYRDTLDSVAQGYLDHCEPELSNTNISMVHNEVYGVDTTVDKELYFSVDHVARRERSLSPDKPNYKAPKREETLSPSKMYVEMNKTPVDDNTPTLNPTTRATVQFATVNDSNVTTIPIDNSSITNINTATTTAASTTNPTTTTKSANRLTLKTRNDDEFNDRAYKLASKFDLTYLVSEFNPAHHSRDKTIILDEDKNTTIASTANANTNSPITADPVPEPPRAELTPAERRAQAKEYADFMKQLYDDEMSLMMEKMVEKLPDQLAAKVRKALAAQQLKQKLKRRKEFIGRRRKIETLLPREIDALAQFYENRSFKGDELMTDSSSEDEMTKRKNDKDMNSLLGEFANVDEATMQAMLAARAMEEQAERDAAEAKRMRRESYLSRKEAEAQARKDAELAAAAAAAEDAAYADQALDAPLDTPETESHKSLAQMRKTIRTFSLMQVTKVLLDGTLIPELSSKNYKPPEEESDCESGGETSPPVRPRSSSVKQRYDENGRLVDVVETTDSDVSGMARPRSRPQSQPFSRPSLWGLPPKSWRGNSVLLNTADDDDVLPEEHTEIESSVLSSTHTHSNKHSQDEEDSGMDDTENISDIHSLKVAPPLRVVRSQRSHRELVIGALGHDLEPPPPLQKEVVLLKSVLISSGQARSSGCETSNVGEVDTVNNVESVDEVHIHSLATVAVEQLLNTVTDTLIHAPVVTPSAPVPAAPAPVALSSTDRVPTENLAVGDIQAVKESTPRRKLSFSVTVPTAVMPRVSVEAALLAAASSAGDVSGVKVGVSDKEGGIEIKSAPVSEKILVEAAVLPTVPSKLVSSEPLTPDRNASKLTAPLPRPTSTPQSAKRPTLPIPDTIHLKSALFEEPSVTSTLTGPESEFMNDFSRENSADFDLTNVQDLLRNMHRPDTTGPDAFVHKRNARMSVSNSIMKVSADGRPPTGIVYSMGKPITPHKPSPMDKVNSLKGLPLLKKPHKKPEHTHTATHAKPVCKTKPHDQGAVSDDRDTMKLSDEPSKPQGLYLIPGAAVASFVQKPAAERPTRPIVYTTRVMMQQKMREYMYDSVPENLSISSLSFSEPPVPLDPSGSVGQVTGQGIKSAVSDGYAYIPTAVHMEDHTGTNNGYTEESAVELELSGELLQHSGVLFEDSYHNITTAKLSTYEHTDISDYDAPRAAGNGTTTLHRAVGNQVENEEELRLNTAEWQLVLNAAREQARDLDLDIVDLNHGSESGERVQGHIETRDLHFTDDISEKLSSSSVQSAHVSSYVDLAPDEAANYVDQSHTSEPAVESSAWRLAKLGEENFNWRAVRAERQRSIVLGTELDDSDVDSPPRAGMVPPDEDDILHASRTTQSAFYARTNRRAPQTLDELLEQLGVVPLRISPNASPTNSPGRARKQVFTVPHHIHAVHESPEPSAPVVSVPHIPEDSVLHITKSQYSKKPDPPPHRPPYVRPGSAHKLKNVHTVTDATVPPLALSLPTTTGESEPVISYANAVV